MKKEMTGIAVCGSVLLDKIYGISAYPKAGELTKIMSIEFSVGGCVPNVAIDLKRLRPDLPVFAVGRIGKDEEGEIVERELIAEGVNTDGLVKSSTKTSFTDVMSILGGQRTFFNYPGAASEFGLNDIKFDFLNVKMLHLGYFLLLDKIDAGDGELILKEAVERGIKTSIDLVSENSDRYKNVIPCLKYTDNLIINEVEAGALSGIEPTAENIEKICRKLKDEGIRERVIIHAPDFGACLSETGFTALPSCELPSGFIKGTTGAGDAFCAGALLAIYEEKSDLEILELASFAAVTALSEQSATKGLKTKEETFEFCKKYERKKLCL